MKVWIVTGEHFNVPGVPLIVCATRERANREAAELVNTMLADTRDVTEVDDAAVPVGEATPDDWRRYAEALEDWHDEGCYVEATEHEVVQ